jgi:hypothetical protein
MSLALTDFLIEVSDPKNLQSFGRDPDAFMSRFGLTDEDTDTIRSGSSARVRFNAKSTDDQDRAGADGQFTGCSNPALIEVEPMVEIMSQANDQIAISGRGLLFVDDSGRLYRGQAE